MKFYLSFLRLRQITSTIINGFNQSLDAELAPSPNHRVEQRAISKTIIRGNQQML